MNPKICAQCGKWFPGLGDLMYHIEQEHIHKLKKQIEKKETNNQSTNQSPQLNKKNVSTQTSQSSLQSSSISSS